MLLRQRSSQALALPTGTRSQHPPTARPAPRASPPVRVSSAVPLRKSAVCVSMSSTKEEQPSYKEAQVSFTNSNGEKLVGRLLDTGSTDVVILCHGYIANSEMCCFPQLAAALARAGLSSLRFDHAMAINSASERKGPFQMGNHIAEVQDMADACEYVRGLGRRVSCLLGHSKGGTNALLFAAEHHDVPKIVNLSGRFRPREGTLQRFGADILERLEREGSVERREADGMTWTFTLADALNRCTLDMEGAARAVPASTRVLCLHGTADTVIPWQESQDAAALLAGGELRLVEGANHNYTRHAEEMAQAVVQFATS